MRCNNASVMASYFFKTEIGTFSIKPTPNGRFDLSFRDKVLGSYATPQQAVDDLVGSHMFSFRFKRALSSLRIAREISAWDRSCL